MEAKQEIKSLSSFWANIYVGLKEKTNTDSPKFHSIWDVKAVCQDYCNDKGFCVTVTQTEYIYTGGSECGAIVGIISYPRFPSDNGELRSRALELAELLRKKTGQFKVTVVMPSEVVMLGENKD
jgi:hypothetical protein